MRVATGVELDHRRLQPDRRLNLPGIGFDE
jgi:hypothetical protein